MIIECLLCFLVNYEGTQSQRYNYILTWAGKDLLVGLGREKNMKKVTFLKFLSFRREHTRNKKEKFVLMLIYLSHFIQAHLVEVILVI